MTPSGVPGVVETVEAHGETTLVVDPARIVEACTHLRDVEGFNMLVDLSGVDYLGWGEKEVAGYIGTPAGRDLNAAGSQGLQRVPDPKPKRFAVVYHLVKVADEGHAPLLADEPTIARISSFCQRCDGAR